MKPAPFDYYRPEGRGEALALLAAFADDAKVLAGGQSLVAAMNMRLARPMKLVDINRIEERAFTFTDGMLAAGMLTRQADLERSGAVCERVPLLGMALPSIGHSQTRSRGTVCGSLAHADPSAELPVVLVALRGRLELASAGGTRFVDADDFFASYFTTALGPGELVTRAYFPTREQGWGYGFAEFAERHGDYAIVAAACALRLNVGGAVDRLRLVLGGVAERPFVVDTSDVLGRALDADAIAMIAERAGRDVDPPSDMRGSAAYRRQLATVFARQTLDRALRDARKDPA